MTVKEYLKQAKKLDALINCRRRELQYWRSLADGVTGSNFQPHYNPNTPTEAPFVRCIEKIDAIERELDTKIDALVDLKRSMSAAIDQLEDHDEQLLLRYRYFENRSWEEIGGLLHVSSRTVHRIHGSALRNFSVPQ